MIKTEQTINELNYYKVKSLSDWVSYLRDNYSRILSINSTKLYNDINTSTQGYHKINIDDNHQVDMNQIDIIISEYEKTCNVILSNGQLYNEQLISLDETILSKLQNYKDIWLNSKFESTKLIFNEVKQLMIDNVKLIKSWSNLMYHNMKVDNDHYNMHIKLLFNKLLIDNDNVTPSTGTSDINMNISTSIDCNIEKGYIEKIIIKISDTSEINGIYIFINSKYVYYSSCSSTGLKYYNIIPNEESFDIINNIKISLINKAGTTVYPNIDIISNIDMTLYKEVIEDLESFNNYINSPSSIFYPIDNSNVIDMNILGNSINDSVVLSEELNDDILITSIPFIGYIYI